jgi:hypothetical protein
MVKRGPHLRPQASEGEAQHGLFCWTRRVGHAFDEMVLAQGLGDEDRQASRDEEESRRKQKIGPLFLLVGQMDLCLQKQMLI